jgi:hypothetical protein
MNSTNDFSYYNPEVPIEKQLNSSPTNSIYRYNTNKIISLEEENDILVKENYELKRDLYDIEQDRLDMYSHLKRVELEAQINADNFTKQEEVLLNRIEELENEKRLLHKRITNLTENSTSKINARETNELRTSYTVMREENEKMKDQQGMFSSFLTRLIYLLDLENEEDLKFYSIKTLEPVRLRGIIRRLESRVREGFNKLLRERGRSRSGGLDEERKTTILNVNRNNDETLKEVLKETKKRSWNERGNREDDQIIKPSYIDNEVEDKDKIVNLKQKDNNGKTRPSLEDRLRQIKLQEEENKKNKEDNNRYSTTTNANNFNNTNKSNNNQFNSLNDIEKRLTNLEKKIVTSNNQRELSNNNNYQYNSKSFNQRSNSPLAQNRNKSQSQNRTTKKGKNQPNKNQVCCFAIPNLKNHVLVTKKN